ncbi:hypothetical protein KUIN1_38360 [Pseudomonas sp. KUIN-1]|nr:hypothetical protein KUIN1_38360 [Pseudomonas sp. KUIN-1]
MQAVVRMLRALRAVAFLEFLVAAARAGIVTTDILKGITHRLLVGMTAVRTVYMAVLVVVVIVVMVAIGACTWSCWFIGFTPQLNLARIIP